MESIEKVVIGNLILNMTASLGSREDSVYATLWAVESYLYNKIRDLSPEEVAKSKESMEKFEYFVYEVQKKYSRANAAWERCRSVLPESGVVKALWDEASRETDEYMDSVKEFMEMSESLRQEMIKNIKDSGVNP